MPLLLQAKMQGLKKGDAPCSNTDRTTKSPCRDPCRRTAPTELSSHRNGFARSPRTALFDGAASAFPALSSSHAFSFTYLAEGRGKLHACGAVDAARRALPVHVAAALCPRKCRLACVLRLCRRRRPRFFHGLSRLRCLRGRLRRLLLCWLCRLLICVVSCRERHHAASVRGTRRTCLAAERDRWRAWAPVPAPCGGLRCRASSLHRRRAQARTRRAGGGMRSFDEALPWLRAHRRATRSVVARSNSSRHERGTVPDARGSSKTAAPALLSSPY